MGLGNGGCGYEGVGEVTCTYMIRPVIVERFHDLSTGKESDLFASTGRKYRKFQFFHVSLERTRKRTSSNEE